MVRFSKRRMWSLVLETGFSQTREDYWNDPSQQRLLEREAQVGDGDGLEPAQHTDTISPSDSTWEHKPLIVNIVNECI